MIPKLLVFNGILNSIPKKEQKKRQMTDSTSTTQISSTISSSSYARHETKSIEEYDPLKLEMSARLYCNGNWEMSKTFVKSFCNMICDAAMSVQSIVDFWEQTAIVQKVNKANQENKIRVFQQVVDGEIKRFTFQKFCQA